MKLTDISDVHPENNSPMSSTESELKFEKSALINESQFLNSIFNEEIFSFKFNSKICSPIDEKLYFWIELELKSIFWLSIFMECIKDKLLFFEASKSLYSFIWEL